VEQINVKKLYNYTYWDILLQDNKTIPGVQVRVYDSNNNKIASTTTDWEGKYILDFKSAGNFQIRFFGEDFGPDNYIDFNIATAGSQRVVDNFLVFKKNVNFTE
jgi:hypothetical protein